MKSRLPRYTLVAAAAVSTCFAFGAAWQPDSTKPAPAAQPGDRSTPPPPPARGPGGPGGPGGREGQRQGAGLEAGMKGMNRAMRQLQDQINDAAKKDDNLRLLGDLERGAVTAKNAVLPEKILSKAKDDAEKAKMATDFRKNLISIVRLALDAEQSVMDGKNADAAAKLDEIAKIRDRGHDAMGVKDED